MIRILLDGVEYGNVIGLEKAKLNIVRDEKIKGLLIKFIDDVTFYDDAYQAILDYAVLNGDCAQMPVEVYFGDDDAEGVPFSGYLIYKDPDTQINKSTKQITCKIQQGDLSGFIIDKFDYVFTVNTTYCIDGATALTQITDRQTSYFTNGGGLTFNGPYETYLVKDVLTQALEFLSNGAISLNAPIFDVKKDEDYYQVDFNTWVAGETMTLEWTNFYGQKWRATQIFTSTEVTSVDNLVARCLHEYPTGGQPQSDVTQYLQKWSSADRDVSNNLDLFSHIPFSDVTISVSPARGGADPIVTKLNDFAFGLQGLAVTKEAYLAGQTTQFRITLGQVLRHLTDVFNLTFSFQSGASGLEMVLQPTEDYFSNIEAVDLGKIKQVDSAFSDDFSINQLNTPAGVNANIFNQTTWNSDICIGSSKQIVATGFSSQDFFNAFTITEITEKLLWAMTDIDVAYANVIRYAYAVVNNSGALVTSFRYAYNSPYFSPLRCYNYFINSNEDYTQQIQQQPYLRATCLTNCDTGIITNTNDILIDTSYTFDDYLTLEQQKTLILSNTQFIRFAIDDVVYNGFINDISINLYTGLATFELLAEDIKQ